MLSRAPYCNVLSSPKSKSLLNSAVTPPASGKAGNLTISVRSKDAPDVKELITL